jgi:hypothetical protein
MAIRIVRMHDVAVIPKTIPAALGNLLDIELKEKFEVLLDR